MRWIIELYIQIQEVLHLQGKWLPTLSKIYDLRLDLLDLQSTLIESLRHHTHLILKYLKAYLSDLNPLFNSNQVNNILHKIIIRDQFNKFHSNSTLINPLKLDQHSCKPSKKIPYINLGILHNKAFLNIPSIFKNNHSLNI